MIRVWVICESSISLKKRKSTNLTLLEDTYFILNEKGIKWLFPFAITYLLKVQFQQNLLQRNKKTQQQRIH